ncbi:MAG: VOC family protein [Candidatus Magasanikbacteria bacterium]|nr:VOC family protein [Candidatus Magasanikbacteria bacterium]
MQKIIPHLWYDKEAKEAAEFYTSLFPDSKITNVKTIRDTPSGDCDIVSFKLWGYSFIAISAGPFFKFNPSISLMVNFDPSQDTEARKRIGELWDKLSDGGNVRMEFQKYPFAEKYGWVSDKYGLDWQLILTNPEGERRPPIIPSLLFVTDIGDKAEEATNFYLSVFKNTKRGQIARYPAGMPAHNASRSDAGGESNKEGAIMLTDFQLEGQWFAAMDGSSAMHKFVFNEAVSFIVHCDTQEEIDYYWEKLSAVPKSEQCGWLKDKYGVSWQIVPSAMDEMMQNGTPEQINRVTQAFLPMKKFDIAKLREAYEGK